MLFEIFLSRTTMTIKFHVPISLRTIDIKACFQDAGLLGCFCVESSNFAVATFLIEHCRRKKESLYLYLKNEVLVALCKGFSVNFNTFKIVQLTFINFNYKKKIPKCITYHQVTVRVIPVVRVP
jgi:hypothetical protein